MKKIIGAFLVLLVAIGVLYLIKHPTVLRFSSQFHPPHSFLVQRVYTTDSYEITYPAGWYIYQFPSNKACSIVSDIPNPQNIPLLISPQSHSLFLLCTVNGPLPASFAYTSGTQQNQTIHAVALNGYSAIAGQEITTFGVGDVVFIANPKGSHVEIRRELGEQKLFYQVIHSLRFR
jgi:hypothetical protein